MHTVIKLTISIIILVLQIQVNTQTTGNLIDFSGTVLDKKTDNPLIYASICKKSSNIGTASNLDGYFKLSNVSIGDKIIISFIGYKEKEIIITHNNQKIYYLLAKNELLKEAERGANSKELKKWNNIVYKELKIDNMAHFNVKN